MNRPPNDVEPESPETTPELTPGTTPETAEPEQTPGRWLLGCFGKALLVFAIVVVLVFGACFMMLTSM